MIETPVIVESAEQLVAKLHLTIPRSEIHRVMSPGIGEVMAAVAAQGVPVVGPLLTHHLRMDPGTFDFEICLPVGAPMAPAGRVELGTLRAARVARTVYHGGYEGLGEAWGEFERWLAAEGHRVAPDLWERYLVGPESGPDASTYRTELNRPLVD